MLGIWRRANLTWFHIMDLPIHVQEALGVDSPIEEDDLSIHESSCQFVQGVFGLSGVEFASAAKNAVSGNVAFKVLSTKRVPNTWRYLEILHNGARECVGVCSPNIDVGFPPTAVAQALVGAWFSDQSLLAGNNMVPNKVVFGVRVDPAASKFSNLFLREWAEASPLTEGCIVLPIWVSKTQFSFDLNSRILNEKFLGFRFQDLFLETISEVKTKWRYLSLYRIFEHGYLSDVFESLKSDFFAFPKESLANATEALNSELNQFLALVQNSGLDQHFASIHHEFKIIKNSGNRFAAALENSFHKNGQLKGVKSDSQKGVLICYKIRCAIVHSGVSSPIFDAFADGAACLEALLPVCESAVLQYLGISAI